MLIIVNFIKKKHFEYQYFKYKLQFYKKIFFYLLFKKKILSLQ